MVLTSRLAQHMGTVKWPVVWRNGVLWIWSPNYTWIWLDLGRASPRVTLSRTCLSSPKLTRNIVFADAQVAVPSALLTTETRWHPSSLPPYPTVTPFLPCGGSSGGAPPMWRPERRRPSPVVARARRPSTAGWRRPEGSALPPLWQPEGSALPPLWWPEWRRPSLWWRPQVTAPSLPCGTSSSSATVKWLQNPYY
jgi:hypothetical protein